MYSPSVFIGSSSSARSIAESVKKELEMRGCGQVKVWYEGVFGLNRGFLETLSDAVNEYDFAVLIWSASDAINSGERVQNAPRDNVVFETGLFMGAMGRDRVFVVHDVNADLKIPSDFNGIMLAGFDGQAGASSISDACAQIAQEMEKERYRQYVGEWRSRYAKAAHKDQQFVNDDVEVSAAMGGILIANKPSRNAHTYSAYGKVHQKQQILGEWRNKDGSSFISGLFMLTMNQEAEMMSGHCTARNGDGALVFNTWVLVKRNGRSNATLDRLLLQGEQELKRRNVGVASPLAGARWVN